MNKVTSKARNILCIAFVLAVGIVLAAYNRANVLEVYVNGKSVGFVKNQEVVEEALTQAKDNLRIEAKNLPIIETRIDYVNSKKILKFPDSKEALEASIYKEIKDETFAGKQNAYKVKIADYTAVLSSKDEVKEVLEAAKDYYDKDQTFTVIIDDDKNGELSPSLQKDKTPEAAKTVMARAKRALPFDLPVDETAAEPSTEAETKIMEPNNKNNTIQVAFVEDIEIKNEYVEEDQVKSAEDVVQDLIVKNVYYKAKKNDTLQTIAKANKLKKAELLKLNPDLEADSKIKPGDQIVIGTTDPNLTVMIQKEETYDVNYSIDPEIIEVSDMFEDETEILAEAQPGLQTVTALVRYQNGEEVDRKILQKRIIRAAVPLKIKKGLKLRAEFIKPINGGIFTSPFGARWGRMHKGIDWSVPIGTRVNAASDGIVVFAGVMNGYGNCITIRHSDGKETRYAHLSQILVNNGASVKQGEQIALSGNTGRSTGPHVHFEIIINGTQVDPLTYLD